MKHSHQPICARFIPVVTTGVTLRWRKLGFSWRVNAADHLNTMLTWSVPSVSWHGCYVTQSRKRAAENLGSRLFAGSSFGICVERTPGSRPILLSPLQLGWTIPNEDAGIQRRGHPCRVAHFTAPEATSWVGGVTTAFDRWTEGGLDKTAQHLFQFILSLVARERICLK